MAFIVIYITHPDEATAKNISNQLVNDKLVACANLMPITSVYWWQGVVENAAEWVSIVKTIPEHWEKVKSAVETLHPYEVPCIMKFDVEANDRYEKWIRESVVL